MASTVLNPPNIVFCTFATVAFSQTRDLRLVIGGAGPMVGVSLDAWWQTWVGGWHPRISAISASITVNPPPATHPPAPSIHSSQTAIHAIHTITDIITVASKTTEASPKPMITEDPGNPQLMNHQQHFALVQAASQGNPINHGSHLST